MRSRDWGLLLESKESYQNTCIANNDPIPHSPTPIPLKPFVWVVTMSADIKRKQGEIYVIK
jgi:hypothetical protein